MSLINKMLQDLDARGTPPGESFPSHIKPVAREAQGPNRRVIAAAVAGALACAAVAWFAWGQFHGARPAQAPAVLAPAPVTTSPVQAPAGQGMTSKITMLPKDAAPEAAPAAAAAAAAAPVAAPPSAPARAAEPVAEPVAEPEVQPKPARKHAAKADKEEAAPKSAAARANAEAAGKPVRAAADPAPYQSVAPVEPDSSEARAVRRALAQELEARQGRRPAAAATAPKGKARPADGRAAPGRVQSVSQRAESEYRRALASMQDGRMIETIAALENALRIDPGHEAARQTLVGLLIEAKRPDEAIRQLQLGLTQDPRQPALAMLLARLQIERGGSGIDTLTRTLPYAGANPDYHAFLAGALQRQQRHREAAAEYAAALRAAPTNGIWWMGMGISLQAEKRNGEALDAFQKALGSGVLSQELQAFVERQVRQLGR